MTYQVKNIPEEILIALDQDWKALVDVPPGLGIKLVSVAIERWQTEAAAENRLREHLSGGISLSRGIVEKSATLTFRMYAQRT